MNPVEWIYIKAYGSVLPWFQMSDPKKALMSRNHIPGDMDGLLFRLDKDDAEIERLQAELAEAKALLDDNPQLRAVAAKLKAIGFQNVDDFFQQAVKEYEESRAIAETRPKSLEGDEPKPSCSAKPSS